MNEVGTWKEEKGHLCGRTTIVVVVVRSQEMEVTGRTGCRQRVLGEDIRKGRRGCFVHWTGGQNGSLRERAERI